MALARADGQPWASIAEATEHTAEIMYGKQADAVEAILARAWDEGFDAGEQDVWDHREKGSFDTPCIRNPYRAPKTPDPGGAPDREAGESLDQRQGDQPPADSTLPGQVSALAAVRRGRRAIDDFNRGHMETGALLMRLAVSLHLAETALAGPDDATRSGGQIGTMTDPYRGGAR